MTHWDVPLSERAN